jgi:DNA-binding MarR family transcriptional regulator
MDMSSASLRVLCQIAESGSFTAAAARLGYTQSAVSRQAVALERSAGATLFQRRPDGVRLTRPGLTLLRHARTILESVDAAERTLDRHPLIERRATPRCLAGSARPGAHRPQRTRLADETAPGRRWFRHHHDSGTPVAGSPAGRDLLAGPGRTTRDPRVLVARLPGTATPAITTVTRAITFIVEP